MVSPTTSEEFAWPLLRLHFATVSHLAKGIVLLLSLNESAFGQVKWTIIAIKGHCVFNEGWTLNHKISLHGLPPLALN